MPPSRARVLVTDLDNTLYDWVGYYIPSFLAMVARLSERTGIDAERLKASFKRVHERHRTTEYSFALQELDVLHDIDAGLSGVEILRKYDDAIHAFRRQRRDLLRCYPGVPETLAHLRSKGVKIVAATESLRYHVVQRLKQLELEPLFDALIAAPDHGFPRSLVASDVRLYGDRYDTVIPVVAERPISIRKPDVSFVAPVTEIFGVLPSEVVYVGDSLRRDVLMAQRAGFRDVFAAYGTAVDANLWAELLKITYWTEGDVIADREAREVDVIPTTTLASFRELQPLFE